MKKIFRKIAIWFTRKYAERIYRQVVSLAEERHNNLKKKVYVITHPTDESKLMCITTEEFCRIRSKSGISSRNLPIAQLKSGCWYYTANGNGKDPIGEHEASVRKEAFILDNIRRAKLA